MEQEYGYTGKAMGTDFSIAIISHDGEIADALAQASIEKIKEYESRFSRFLSDSELSQLNTLTNMVVSDTFMKVTEKAYILFMETNGIFNPLVQIGRLGYTKSFNDLDTTHTVEDTGLYNIDFSTTIIDATHSRIILEKGQKLDFGGFLKGYLAELLAIEIKNHSVLISGVIVNIGGDIHTKGLDADGNNFILNIYNPITKKDDIHVQLHDQSLATSGTYKRTWDKSGAQVHHILDVSGMSNPDTDVVSVSIMHPDGSTAEAYTKVFFSVEPKEAHKILEDRRVHYVIIKKNGDILTNIT